MPSFKAQIRPYSKQDSKTNIKIRISHNKKVRYIKTPYNILPEDFDNVTGRVRKSYLNADDMNVELKILELKYEKKALNLGGRIEYMNMNKLIKYLRSGGEDLDFFSYTELYLKEYSKIHSFKYLESINNSINNIRKFYGDNRLYFTQITNSWLKQYQNYFKEKGLAQNSIAIDITTIRTIFNHAINNDYVSLELYPFRKFRIVRSETAHRDLSLEDFRKILRCQSEASDIFMLSFCLIGINYKDLLFAIRELQTRAKFVPVI